MANFRYSNTGAAVESNDGNGHESAACLDPTFAKPAAITPQGNSNLTTSVNYTQALAPGSVTEPNNAVTSIVYDGVSRPSQTTSKFGAVTTYEYSNSPAWRKATTNGRWVKTWVDSFGRTIKMEKGDTSGPKSVQETEYGPCACSPLGKVSRVSRPHAPGQTPAWTTYQYDARGRTTRVTLPDGSATVYAYAGSAVTITDAASKWKTPVTDAFGNLVQVVEPNPAGGDNWVTNYTFDQFDRLVQVSMPRGTVTQTRTWSYDATTQRLNSVTQPETGTTTYTWNADGTLLRKTDARGMKVQFTYNPEGRMTQIGTEVYRYGADGTRLMKGALVTGESTCLYFRDPWGRLRQVLAYYRSPVNGYEQLTVSKRYDWFVGKPVERGAQKWLGQDRLGSVRAVVAGGPSAWAVTTRTTYAPYGEANGGSTGTWGYGTHWREGNGLNYAEQRWYGVAGRFTSADRYGGSGRVRDPGSWNRYGYVGGDPVNRNDPKGLFWCSALDREVESEEACWDPSAIGSLMDRPLGPAYDYEAAAFVARYLAMQVTTDLNKTMLQGRVSSLTGTNCERLFTNDREYALTMADLRSAAANVRIWNTEGLEGNLPLSEATGQAYDSDPTISDYSRGTNAAAYVVSGNSIFITSTYFAVPGLGQRSAIGKGTILLHELLHIMTGLGDKDIAGHFGVNLPPDASEDDASQAFQNWLRRDCNNE